MLEINACMYVHIFMHLLIMDEQHKILVLTQALLWWYLPQKESLHAILTCVQ